MGEKKFIKEIKKSQVKYLKQLEQVETRIDELDFIRAHMDSDVYWRRKKQHLDDIEHIKRKLLGDDYDPSIVINTDQIVIVEE